MLKNYLKIAWRNFVRHKTYSIINVAGLAIGIACVLVITFYVRNELSYDNFHENGARIFRALWSYRGVEENIAVTPSAFGPILKREFPEVVATVRFFNTNSFGPVVVSFGEKQFLEKRFLYADSTVFDIFTFPLLAGHPQTALTRPNTVLLTESTAHKLFGEENPIGKTIRMDNTRDFEVTGVLKDLPANSHLQFDYLASFVTLSRALQWEREKVWGNANYWTYLLLQNQQSAAALNQEKIPALIARERGKDSGLSFVLQPLQEVHLYSQNVKGDAESGGNIGYVYGFSAIAILILVVACINYMNLATARSARRAREVGMRKMLGAHRGYLAGQFLGESFFITLLAMAIAIGLVEFVLPALRSLLGIKLDLHVFENFSNLVFVIGLCLAVSLLAGSYPAFFLAKFQPVVVLKESLQKGAKGAGFRRMLVVFQFAVSVFLAIGTIVVGHQLSFLRNKQLGFNKEQIVVLPIGDRELQRNYVTLKNELLRHANILSASAVSSVPGKVRAGYGLTVEGQLENESYSVAGLTVDRDFIETAGLDLILGHGFPLQSKENEYDFVINETALKKLGWPADPSVLGRGMNLNNREGRLVGVVKDFHFTSLHDVIRPIVMFSDPSDYEFLMVKIRPENLPATMAHAAKKWKEIVPYRPFEFSFLDQEIDALYRFEAQVEQFFNVFAVLAIVIACLGLYGLAAFTAEQRTKEVGIRKVLGATVSGIALLLSKEFTKFVVLAILIASPIAYLIMNDWLQDFAYHINVGWWVFLLAGGMALAVALLTVSTQAIKAALANPVEALRYE